MELCWDCKDNILKFFHFKRKVKEVQSRKRSKNQHSYSDESYSTSNAPGLCIQSRQPSTTTSASLTTSNRQTDVSIKSEPASEDEDFQFDPRMLDAFDKTDNFSDIVIKEEPEDRPIILRDQFTALNSETDHPQRQLRNNSQPTLRRKRNLHESQISYGAQKMRAYRQRLKEPENRMKLLRQKQLQREWNRRAYIKKQLQNGLPIRTRRRDYSDFFLEMGNESAQWRFRLTY